MNADRKLAVLAIALVILGTITLTSVFVGAFDIDLATILQILFGAEPDNAARFILQDIRFPRVISAMVVGAALGAAGSMMQGVTRNPLASPTLMGLNAGAGLGVAIGFAVIPDVDFSILILFSFAGAGLGVGLSIGIGMTGRGGASPLRLALAGAAVSALLGAVGAGVTVGADVSQDILFFMAGGVQGTGWTELKLAGPWITVGLCGALFLSPSLSLLALGDEIAVTLGTRLVRVRIGATASTLLLAGAAVSIAGQVGFVGLAAPHIARLFVGHDYRWVTPFSMLTGAILLVGADLIARSLNPPHETPVSLLTALIGAPVILWIARRDIRGMI